MTYAFARIDAVIAMRVEDYHPNGKRWWVRLHCRGDKPMSAEIAKGGTQPPDRRP